MDTVVSEPSASELTINTEANGVGGARSAGWPSGSPVQLEQAEEPERLPWRPAVLSSIHAFVGSQREAVELTFARAATACT